MSSPSPEVVGKVRQWLRFAEEDLALASHAMGLPRGPYRLIAYHAQQCAEKCLKAFLVYCNVDFPYTHSIRALLSLCKEHTSWTETLRDAEELTPYAVTARYPGEDVEVSQEEARRAIEVARQVSAQVRATLQERGVEIV
jgi:HEPN domain-containing protein